MHIIVRASDGECVLVSNAKPYPNQGFPENRKTLQKAIMQDLQAPPSPARE
jgi:hypothetical protein